MYLYMNEKLLTNKATKEPTNICTGQNIELIIKCFRFCKMFNYITFFWNLEK